MKSKYIPPSSLLIMSAALIVAGCSDRSNDEPPAVGNPADQITLSGLVVDDRLPGARVCIHLDGQEVSCAFANSDAEYTITVPRPAANQKVQLVATKEVSDVAGEIKLTSTLGLGQDLPELTSLNQELVPRLAVTNLTSAQDVLATNASGQLDLSRLQQINASVPLSKAAEAIAISIKDQVDSLLEGSSFELGNGINTQQIAQQTRSVVEEGALNSLDLNILIEMARSSSQKALVQAKGSSANPATAHGDNLQDSEAYELSSRPQLRATHFIKPDATAPELLSFDHQGEATHCTNNTCTTVTPELSWNAAGPNWQLQIGPETLTINNGVPQGYEEARSLPADQYRGWYFIELQEASGSFTYQSHLFGLEGEYAFRDEALNRHYRQADGWNWIAFKTLEELRVVTPQAARNWSITGRTLQVGDDTYFRISDSEAGQWRFLKRAGNDLSVTKMLPLININPDAPSHFDQLEQLASTGSGYSFLTFFPGEDYFAWLNYFKSGDKVKGCGSYIGDQDGFDIFCSEEITPHQQIRNLLRSDVLDRDPPESFNSYFHGDLNTTAFFVEEKIHCGDNPVCSLNYENSYHDLTKTARTAQPLIRTFDWDATTLSLLAGKTLAFQILHGTEPKMVEIRFEDTINSSQTTNLLASIKLGESVIPITNSQLAAELGVLDENDASMIEKPAQLARGFIHVNLTGNHDFAGKQINGLQLFLHTPQVSENAESLGVSLLRVAIDSEGETSFFPLPSAVNTSASIH